MSYDTCLVQQARLSVNQPGMPVFVNQTKYSITTSIHQGALAVALAAQFGPGVQTITDVPIGTGDLDEYQHQLDILRPKPTEAELDALALRILARSAILACPNTILDPDHYTADGSCDCYNAAAGHMKDRGYQWSEGAWR